MIRSMWAISFPSPTNDSPMKKSAAITTSRSGWGPRVISAGRHECGVRAAWSEGVEGHAVPRLRVAPTEPYRWGANLPAASAGVKAARLVALWDVFGVIPAADAGRDAPHFVRQPFETLLRVIELRGRHPFRAPSDLARVRHQLVQEFAQRTIAATLVAGSCLHALWIPSARSSAVLSSAAAARTVDASPRSAR